MQENQENLGTQASLELPLEADQSPKQTTNKPAANKPKKGKSPVDAYVPEKGFERMVAVLVSKGDRYDSKTGKEINPPKKVYYSYSEWQVVKVHHKSMGIEFTEVLYNPFDKED